MCMDISLDAFKTVNNPSSYKKPSLSKPIYCYLELHWLFHVLLIYFNDVSPLNAEAIFAADISSKTQPDKSNCSRDLLAVAISAILQADICEVLYIIT